jgi:hypothetical protein
MELRLNCAARLSDDVSEDGCKQVWTSNTSKGCSSRLFSCISQLIWPPGTRPYPDGKDAATAWSVQVIYNFL